MSAGPALEASSSIDNGHAGLHKVSSSITMGSHDENQESVPFSSGLQPSIC